MSNTAVIIDPSKNNMDGTSEVSAHPPLTSIAGHFDWSNQHIKSRGGFLPSVLVDPHSREYFFYLIRFLRHFYLVGALDACPKTEP